MLWFWCYMLMLHLEFTCCDYCLDTAHHQKLLSKLHMHVLSHYKLRINLRNQIGTERIEQIEQRSVLFVSEWHLVLCSSVFRAIMVPALWTMNGAVKWHLRCSIHSSLTGSARLLNSTKRHSFQEDAWILWYRSTFYMFRSSFYWLKKEEWGFECAGFWMCGVDFNV